MKMFYAYQNPMEINRKPIGEIEAQEKVENWEAEI
jgi:hypothetical protein